MRILHILNDVTDRGNGIVNTTVDLAIEQARQGHRVAIASAGGGYEPLLSQRGVCHLTLNQSRRPMQIFRALRLLRQHIRNFRPDVVHAHMRTGMLLAWLWARIYRFALVAHVHNVHDRESVLMGLAERVIAVSRSVAQTMGNQGIPREAIRVVLNGTLGTPRHPEISNVNALTLERPAIVSVGGMYHRKGIAELLSAFEIVGERFPDAHLYLVGDGPDRRLFEEQARRSRYCTRIHFEGFQSTPQAYMLSADAFVLASRRESFGLVLIEARQAGCPIVASNTDGTAEALDDGLAGLLVPPRDIAALAAALCRLLTSDAERSLWRRKALRGVERFHVATMASEVVDVYRELVREPYLSDIPEALSASRKSA
jgi:glycosyltransferase involved in cell wall biosynthesis